jgi:hypothetical protein
MDHQSSSDADCVAQARNLIARAAKGVEKLENASSHAFCRLTALVGILTRLEEFARSSDPEIIDAALLDAATVCREAEVLLRYIDSLQMGPVQVVANRRAQARSPALLGGGLASGG